MGRERPAVLALALARMGPSLPAGRVPVVVAAANAGSVRSLGQPVAARWPDADRACSIVTPPRLGATFWSSQPDWVAVDVSDRAERLDRVWLPRSIVEARTLIAVNDLDQEASARPVVAIGIWSRFAHPRQRLGARLTDARDGLTAEIALAVRPRLVILADRRHGWPLVIATPDQIAAELAGLALRRFAGLRSGEPVGPWEDPLVQRATELGLGVRWPGEIALSGVWVGGEGDPERAMLDRLLGEIAQTLGIENLPPSDVS